MSDLDFVTFADRHIPARVAWLNDPAVLTGVPLVGSITERSTQEWARRVAAATDRADFVLESSSGDALVMCGITNIENESSRGELYMFADPRIHGAGYGSLALKHLCNWGFEERRLNRIFLFTLEHNHGARRFYERAGFRPEGCLRQHQLYAGELVDRHVHGLLAHEWRKDAVNG